MIISEKTKRVLEILNVPFGKGLSAREFSDQMWPDSPARNRSYNVGNGATHGAGLWKSAGSYLSRLRKTGLIRDSFGEDGYSLQRKWRITELGIKTLKDADAN